MQGQEKKYFTGVNADDDADLLGPGDYVNAENIRWGTTDQGATARLENVGGTKSLTIDFPLPSGAICIGGTVDRTTRYIVFFIYSTTGNSINLYDIAGKATYKLIEDIDVEGGLNFDKYSLVHSARVVNDILYWTDNISEPRRINIGAALKAHNGGVSPYPSTYQFVYPASFDEISLIRRPAPYPPAIMKNSDTSFLNNFIGNESFQFAYQYLYYDGEKSVLGPWSTTSRLNKSDETFNFIDTQLSLNEFIPQTVRVVRLVVRVASTLKSFVVREWDRLIISDAAEISNHNADIAPLTFDFYNNLSGEFIDDATAFKPFDSVPLISGALEVARNRIFLGDNTEGYDTPIGTSMILTQTETDLSAASSVVKQLVEVRAAVNMPGPSNDFAYGGYYVFLSASDGVTAGYYLLNGSEKNHTGIVGLLPPEAYYLTIPALDPAPSSTSIGGLTFIGATQADVIDYILHVYNGGDPGNTIAHDAFLTGARVLTVTGITGSIYNIFKPRSNDKAGIVFFDYALRKCGVVTNNGLLFNTPSRDFAFTSAVTSIMWTLTNTFALQEIPDWAYYYAPVRTLNLTTRYFVSAFDKSAKYATKDADGLYVFTNTTLTSQVVGIGLDTTSLIQAGLGYVFSQGDVAVIVDDLDNTYELPVIGQSGNYIIVSTKDIGDTSVRKFIYEIYTPYRPSAQEPFYEMGSMYRVLDPGTDSRTFETLTGQFGPDMYAITRNFDTDTYFAEAMSPNDLFYNRWDTDAGRINIITRDGQKRKNTNISFSNVYIPGTPVNGLSSFDALDEENLPFEIGTIRKLILASKVEQEGTVMLCIAEGETASVYLGETQIFDASNDSFIAKSNNVIGQVNILQGSYGTKNPESVVFYKGEVYWFDVINGAFVFYSNNGVFPVSNYKLRRVAKLLADAYAVSSNAEIEALGSRPFVFGGVDNYHGEILFSIPTVSPTIPKGTLTDYDSSFDSGSSESSESSDGEATISYVKYPYDIWDQQAKTLVFKTQIEGTQFGNRWMGAFTFSPEWMLTDGNQLYSFENGVMWIHNDQSAYNTFYDVEYRSRLMFACNQEPSKIKSFKAISIESNQVPVFTHLRTELPYIQSSDLIAENYKEREGIFYAGLYKDRLSPNVSGSVYAKRRKGDPIKSNVLLVLLEFSSPTSILAIRFVNISYNYSHGHKT